jgi:hypothetical protein
LFLFKPRFRGQIPPPSSGEMFIQLGTIDTETKNKLRGFYSSSDL